MGILKFGLVGVIIMMPFIFIAYVQEQQVWNQQLRKDQIEATINEATYDAAFAIKAYSQAAFDGEKYYQISIPYEAVTQTFFDSLRFRDFQYVKSDFLLLIFIDYDGIVIYDPNQEKYFPKFYYANQDSDTLTYVNLSYQITQVNLLDDSVKKDQADKSFCDPIIYETMENAIKACLNSAYPEKNVSVNLPMYDDSAMMLSTNDVSFMAIYRQEVQDLTMSVEEFYIKPSGIMKILPLFSIDIFHISFRIEL